MAHAKKRGKKWRCLVFSHYEMVDNKKVRKYKSFTADSKKEAGVGDASCFRITILSTARR